MNKVAKIGILIASDRAKAGVYEDLSGKAIREVLGAFLKSAWEAEYRLVSDDLEGIKSALLELSKECSLILTSGGTGPAPRDVTPDATIAVCDKILPGFGEAMRKRSFEIVPTAILSRQCAGICGKTLIVNLPGSPKSIRECLEVVFPAIPECLDLIGGDFLECDERIIKAHRAH